MKKLTLLQIESVTGGDGVDSFCASFAAAAGFYQFDVWATVWKPVGQGALIAADVISGKCIIYTLR
jgi:hypothetical protein